MALPTLTKTWNFDVNNYYSLSGSALGTMRNAVFQIKKSLKNSGGWTVLASSNQSIANTSDNWTSTNSLNWGNPGAARSWIILGHPTNNSQLLIDLNNTNVAYPFSIYFSKQGWNVSGAFSISSVPALNVSGDSIDYPAPGNMIFGATDQAFVHHYIYSSDGYSHRTIIYCQDVPVFGLFLDTPEVLLPEWSVSGLPSYIIFLYSTGSIVNCFTIANFYQSAIARTRIGPVGIVSVQNISLFLSAEAYNSNLLVNGLQIPNDLTGEYPMLEIGLVSNTSPYFGKIGKVSDLWFGVTNLIGSPSYPDDGSAQFVQHGCIITPWNGSTMLTR